MLMSLQKKALANVLRRITNVSILNIRSGLLCGGSEIATLYFPGNTGRIFVAGSQRRAIHLQWMDSIVKTKFLLEKSLGGLNS